MEKAELRNGESSDYKGLGKGENEERLVKGYRGTVGRCISSGDIMHRIVLTVNNAVRYTQKLLRD